MRESSEVGHCLQRAEFGAVVYVKVIANLFEMEGSIENCFKTARVVLTLISVLNISYDEKLRPVMV